jgi:hypothetical protein
MSNENVQIESNLKTLQENVNQLETRFDKLLEDVVLKLNECSNCIKAMKQERKDSKVKLATTPIKGKVILDVGGEKYITSVDTLTREKDSFFTALFSKQWELERDPDDKSIFIDGNGKIFTYILEYLRTSIVPNNVWKDETTLHSLIIEAQYFGLHNLIDLLEIFPNGTLLQLEHKMKLNEFYGKIDQRWELIYKASRHGFDATAFHSRCDDNKEPTITIIQSNNNCLFGGYTSIPWASDSSYKNDATAFLFTLTNPHNIPPTKYFIKSYRVGTAIYGKNNYGPTFGAGHDIYLANNSNSNSASYIYFPHSYIDTTGQYEKTFAGDKNFSTSDIEVFKLA